MTESKNPLPKNLKFLIDCYTEPLIFKNVSQKSLWEISDFDTEFANKALPFREGKWKFTKNPQWENITETVRMSFSEFLEKSKTRHDKWWYFDYKRIPEWCSSSSEISKKISWEDYGFPNITSNESTLWIGNYGAHTSCHMDTYGCNLVHQIVGQKKWILFPPETSGLKPSRIPYEESSVFSELNFFSPDIELMKGISGARIVTLDPSDVLFVPYHWWHYVENVSDLAISINAWLPLEQDNEMRLQESIVQFLVSEFIKESSIQCAATLLNSKEENIDSNFNTQVEQVELCSKIVKEKHQETTTKFKKLKNSSDDSKKSENHTYDSEEIINQYSDYIKRVPTLSPIEFKNFLIQQKQRFSEYDESENTEVPLENGQFINNFIKSLCDPEVIDLVAKKLLQKSKENR